MIILYILFIHKQYNICFVIIFAIIIYKIFKSLNNVNIINCSDEHKKEHHIENCIEMTYSKLILFIIFGTLCLCVLIIIWLYVLFKTFYLTIDVIFDANAYTIAILLILIILIYFIYKAIYNCFSFIRSLLKTRKIECSNDKDDNNNNKILGISGIK